MSAAALALWPGGQSAPQPASRRLTDQVMSDNKSSDKLLADCSFCGKSQHEVKKLIQGPQVYICDECVELCNDIGEEQITSPALASPGEGKRAPLPTPTSCAARLTST